MTKPPDPPHPAPAPAAAAGALTRRAVLAGGAGALLLAACGSGGSGASGSTTTAPGRQALLAFFDAAGDTGGFIVTGSAQRATFGVAGPDGSLLTDSPATLDLVVRYPGGSTRSFTAARHNKGLPRSYYALDFTPPTVGDYQVATRLDGVEIGAAFSVLDPAKDPTPRPGHAMPALVTPTTAAPHGVDPVCTRSPVCPLHDVSLDKALALGRPVAFLVATPKFCQVAICGPVLDVLLGVRQRYAGKLTMIHQEVYRSAKQAAEQGNAAALAPALDSLKLGYEPALFLVGTDGRIARRIDFIYDEAELTAALDALVS